VRSVFQPQARLLGRAGGFVSNRSFSMLSLMTNINVPELTDIHRVSNEGAFGFRRTPQATFSGLSFSYSARLASDVSQRSTACCMLSQN